jgi:hypothetical protein
VARWPTGALGTASALRASIGRRSTLVEHAKAAAAAPAPRLNVIFTARG